MTIGRTAKTIFLKNLDDIANEDRACGIYLTKDNDSKEVQDFFASKLPLLKKFQFVPVVIVSTDGNEKIGFAEQMVMSSLALAATNRLLKKMSPSSVSDLLCETGSFDGLYHRSNELLKLFSNVELESQEHFLLHNALAECNKKLANFYWELGYQQTASNLLGELAILLKKSQSDLEEILQNTDEMTTLPLNDKLKFYLKNILRAVTCAILLKDYDLSNKILCSTIPEGDYLKLMQDGPIKKNLQQSGGDLLSALNGLLKKGLTEEEYSHEVRQATNEINTIKAIHNKRDVEEKKEFLSSLSSSSSTSFYGVKKNNPQQPSTSSQEVNGSPKKSQ